MKKKSYPYLNSLIVGKTILDHLVNQDVAYASLRLNETPAVMQKSWSTIYFITYTGHEEQLRLVAKIPHFPDQARPEISWQSPELLTHGQKEFNAITWIYKKFGNESEGDFAAIPPRAYIPEINAIVMDRVYGKTLYKECFTIRMLLTRRGQRQAERLFYLTGQWLRKCHDMPKDDLIAKDLNVLNDPLEDLKDRVGKLKNYGVVPMAPDTWKKIIAILGGIKSEDLIQVHSDFHLQNVLVLSKKNVLSFDTAMSKLGSPCYDLGKFLASLKTRRQIIQSFGVYPSQNLRNRLGTSFLKGYFADSDIPVLKLALYEGLWIFEKWLEYHEKVKREFRGPYGPIGAKLLIKMVNVSFYRIISQWVGTITTAARD